MKNKMLEKFLAGKNTLGTITHLNSACGIEGLGYTPLDYVLIDMEHSPVDIESAAECIAAAQAACLTPLVRINEVSKSPILRLLDIGAQGLVIPCVESVEQVRQVIEYAKYAPLGARGYCMTRDGGWGFAEHALGGMAEYMRICNEQTLLLPQCETLGCLEHIEEIVALRGVDGILIGPFDLSIAMGKPGQLDDPEIKAAITRIRKACEKEHK